MPFISLYTPWKHEKARGIERNQWHEVIKIKRSISSKFVISLKLHQNIVFHIVFHIAFYFVTYVHSSFVHSFMDLLNWAIKDQCFHHLETSCIFALQINLTDVYMARKLVVNGLTHMLKVKLSELINSYSPWNHQKTIGFLIFLWGIKVE